MNNYICKYVYFVPICIFTNKLNRGGGLPRSLFTSLMMGFINYLIYSIIIALNNKGEALRGNPPPSQAMVPLPISLKANRDDKLRKYLAYKEKIYQKLQKTARKLHFVQFFILFCYDIDKERRC